MTVRYWECSKIKCKWIGTEEEKAGIPDKDFPSLVEIHVCPKCENDSFYEVKGKKKIENHLSKIKESVTLILPDGTKKKVPVEIHKEEDNWIMKLNVSFKYQ